MKVENNISEDEAALYDRQIRLWGVEAQKRLLNSRVLLINLKGLGAEIAKNLVLSGISSLTILDDKQIDDYDLKTNFLFEKSALGEKRASACIKNLQILNSNVKLIADCESIENKDDLFFINNNFDLICCLFNDNYKQLLRINNLCRANNIYFLNGYVFGLYAYMFSDLNAFKYICEAPKISEEDTTNKNSSSANLSVTSAAAAAAAASKGCDNRSVKDVVLQEKEKQFASLEQFMGLYNNKLNNITNKKAKRLAKSYFIFNIMRQFYDEHNREPTLNDKQTLIDIRNEYFAKYNLDNAILDDSCFDDAVSDTCAVNAILGGVMAQEIIKVISKKNEPIDNFFLFDGDSMSGVVETVGYN